MSLLKTPSWGCDNITCFRKMRTKVFPDGDTDVTYNAHILEDADAYTSVVEDSTTYKIYTHSAIKHAIAYRDGLADYKSSLGITKDSTASEVTTASTLVASYIDNTKEAYDIASDILESTKDWSDALSQTSDKLSNYDITSDAYKKYNYDTVSWAKEVLKDYKDFQENTDYTYAERDIWAFEHDLVTASTVASSFTEWYNHLVTEAKIAQDDTVAAFIGSDRDIAIGTVKVSNSTLETEVSYDTDISLLELSSYSFTSLYSDASSIPTHIDSFSTLQGSTYEVTNREDSTNVSWYTSGFTGRANKVVRDYEGIITRNSTTYEASSLIEEITGNYTGKSLAYNPNFAPTFYEKEACRKEGSQFNKCYEVVDGKKYYYSKGKFIMNMSTGAGPTGLSSSDALHIAQHDSNIPSTVGMGSSGLDTSSKSSEIDWNNPYTQLSAGVYLDAGTGESIIIADTSTTTIDIGITGATTTTSQHSFEEISFDNSNASIIDTENYLTSTGDIFIGSMTALGTYRKEHPLAEEIGTGSNIILIDDSTFSTYDGSTDTITAVNSSLVYNGTYYTSSNTAINSDGTVTDFGSDQTYVIGGHTYINNNGDIVDYTSSNVTGLDTDTVGSYDYVALGDTLAYLNNSGDFSTISTTNLNGANVFHGADGSIGEYTGNNNFDSLDHTTINGVDYFNTGTHTIGTYNASEGLEAANVITVNGTDYIMTNSNIVTENASVFNSLTYTEIDHTKWFVEDSSLSYWDSQDHIGEYNITLTSGNYEYVNNSSTNTLVAHDTSSDAISAIDYTTIDGTSYFTDLTDTIHTIGSSIGDINVGHYEDDYLITGTGVIKEETGSFTSVQSSSTEDHSYFLTDSGKLVSSSISDDGTINISLVDNSITSLVDSDISYAHAEDGTFIETDANGIVTAIDSDYTVNGTDYLMIEEGGHIAVYDETGKAVEVGHSDASASSEAWFDYLAEHDLLSSLDSDSQVNNVELGIAYANALTEEQAFSSGEEIEVDPLTGKMVIDGKTSVVDDDGNLYVYDDDGVGTSYILDTNVDTVGYSKMTTVDEGDLDGDGNTDLTTVQMNTDNFIISYADGSTLVADGNILADTGADFQLDLEISQYIPNSIGLGDLDSITNLSVVYSEDEQGENNGSIVKYTFEDDQGYESDVQYTVDDNTEVIIDDASGVRHIVNVDNSDKWTIDIDQHTGDISASVNEDYDMSWYEDDDQRYTVQSTDDAKHIYAYSTDKDDAGVNQLEATTTVISDTLRYTVEEATWTDPSTWFDGFMPDVSIEHADGTTYDGGLLTDAITALADLFTDDPEILETVAEVGFVTEELVKLYIGYKAVEGLIAGQQAKMDLVTYLKDNGVEFSNWENGLLLLDDIITATTAVKIIEEMVGVADSIYQVISYEDNEYDPDDPMGIKDTPSVSIEAVTEEDLTTLNALVDEDAEATWEDFGLEDTIVIQQDDLIEHVADTVEATGVIIDEDTARIKRTPAHQSILLVDDSYFGMMAGSEGYDSQLAGGSLFSVDTIQASTQGVTFSLVNSHISNAKIMNLPYEDLAGGSLFTANQDLRVNGVI